MIEKIEYWQYKKNMLWYFRIMRSKGKIIMYSDGYFTKEQCIHGINGIIGDLEDIQPSEIQSQTNLMQELEIFNTELGG